MVGCRDRRAGWCFGVVLGVGIGWNAVEYDALGEDFGTRGARSEEQIERVLVGGSAVIVARGSYRLR